MISTYKNLKQIFAFVIALFLLLGVPLLFPLNAYATINETFNFQAKLTNVNGTNVTDGTYNFRFSIYDASSAGNCLWTSKGTIPGSGSCTYAGGSPGTDLVAVTVTNGLFNVNLGTTAGSLTTFEDVSASLAKFSNNSLYLDIQVYNGSSWETFGSRKLLESVPYAFRAKYADTSTNVPLSGITAATTTNTIDNLLNAQTWNWSTLSTQTALSYSANSLTTGGVLGISSSTTAASASGDLVKFELTGNSANVTGNALKVGVTGGSSTTATALNVTSAGTGLTFRVNDDGTYTDSTPFIIDTSGNVAIGATAATARLSVSPATTNTGRAIDAGASQLGAGDTFSIYNPISLSITDVTTNVYGMYNTGSSTTVAGGLGTPSTRLVGVNNVFTASATGVPGTHENRIIGMYTDLTTTGNRNPIGYGNYFVTNSSSSSGTQYVSYADMSAGSTTKWGLYFTGESNNYLSGNLGIGDISPAAALTVGSGDKFQVDTNGNILKINNVTTSFPASQGGTNAVLQNDGSGGLTWSSSLTGVTIPISKLAVAAATNTIDNTLYAQTWDWSTLSTQNGLTLTGNALTTGNILGVTSSTIVASGSGDVVKFEQTGNSANFTGNTLKVGITGASSAGIPLNVTNAGTGFTLIVNDDGTYADASPFSINASGDVGIGTTTPDSALEVKNSGFPQLTLRNGGSSRLWIGTDLTDFIFKASNDYSANSWKFRSNNNDDVITINTAAPAGSLFIDSAGNVGLQDITPASAFTVGNGDLFQVNSTGNIVKINNVTTSFPGSQGGSNTYLKNNGSGVLTWDTISASASISSLTLAGGTNTIDNTLYAQTWDWSTLSTQNALTLTGNGITTGNLLSLTSTSTALTSSSLLNVLSTGDPAASWTGALAKVEYTTSTDADINGDILRAGITGAGTGQGTTLNITTAQTGTNALAFRVNDDGTYTDSTPFAIDKTGNTSIGSTTFTSLFNVGSSAQFQVNSSGNVVASGLSAMGAIVSTTSGQLTSVTSTTGNFLRHNGTTWVANTIQSGDLPTGSGNYIQNQIAGEQSSSNFWISRIAGIANGDKDSGGVIRFRKADNTGWDGSIYQTNANIFTILAGAGGRVDILDSTGVPNTTYLYNRYDDNSLRTNLILTRSRSSATAPSANFGASIDINLEGFTNTSDILASRISTFWENNQTNDTTDRDAAITFSTVLNNTFNERVRISSAGNLGIADASPLSLLTVGNGDLFQVNSSGQIAAAAGIISSGTIQFSTLTSNGPLYTSGGNGTLTTTAPTSGAIGYWSRSGTTISPTTANDVLSISGNTSDIIYATSSSSTADNKVLNVWQSGATSGTDYAGYFYNSGGSTTNVAIYAASAFSGGSDYAIITNGGNVGIGDTSPVSLLTVGSSDTFQVNTSGNIVKINNVTTSFPASQGGSNTYLKNNGSGVLTWDTVSASASLGALSAAAQVNTIDNTLYAQTWDWSTLSTQNALTLTGNGITTGNLLSLTSSSTALTSSSLLNILSTGDPAASWTGALAKIEYTTSIDTDINGDGLRVGITGAGAGQGTTLNITSAQTGTNAFVFKVNDDGTYTDTTAFSVDKAGVIRAGGQYLAPDGAIATPSFGFLNNTNMGFYRYGNNVMGTSVNGQGGFFLDGTSGTGRVSIDYPVAAASKFQISNDANTTAGGITLGTNASTYIQIYKSASNKLTIGGGNVGIGDTAPASLFTVGASGEFQVNSTGNIVKINNVTTSFPGSQGGVDTYLKNNGSGTLTWSTVSASASISGLTLAGGTNTIDNTLYAQTWDWSTLSTQNALTLTGNGITTGNLLSLTSTSTALTSSSLLNILATGDPAASWTGALAKVEYTTSLDADINGDILRVGVTGAGAGQGTTLNITTAQTGTNALAFRVNDDGTYSDSSPFIVDKAGSVGIGVTSIGSERLNVDNKLRLVTSGTPEAGYLFGTSIPSGSLTEGSGEILTYAINVPQVGSRDNGRLGGFFRLETRTGYEAESFVVYGYPSGGGTGYQRLSVNLSTGDTYLAASSGNVTIGSSTLTSMFNVGTGAQFQVNSTGNIVKINNVTTSFPGSQGGVNTYLKNNGSGVLTWDTVSASASISGLTLAGGTNTIDNTLYAQTWDWSTLSTQNALTLTGNGITTGNLLSLTSTSTALTSSNLLNVLATGDPAASWTGALAKIEYTTSLDADINGDGLRVGITGAGGGQGTALNITSAQTGTNALAFRVNDDGTYSDSTAFTVDKDGNVGIGTTAPGAKLQVVGGNILLDNASKVYMTSITNGAGYYFDASSAWGLRGYNSGANYYTDILFDSTGGSGNNSRGVRIMDTNGSAVRVLVGDTGYVGIGDTTPASLLSVGNGDLFQVDTSGNIVKINNVTTSFPGSQGGVDTYLKNNGSGTLTWSTVSASASISGLTLAGGTNTIDNTLYAQQWNWSTLTSESALTLNSGSITTGRILKVAGGTAMTTGSALEVNGSTFVHGANSEVGNLALMSFSDTTSGAYTSTTNGILMQPTINITAGAANKTINGISVNPTFTACTTATCTVNGLNVANVTDSGNFNSTGLKIGTGWDEAINASGNVTIGTKVDATAHNFASGCNCLTNSAIGTFGSGGADTNRDAVSSAVVYKGKLFISTKEADLAGVYRYDGGTNPWTLVTNVVGKAISTDTANIDAFVLAVFNGALYAGSQTGTGTNTGALYQSTTAETGTDVFSATLVNTARGSFGLSQTSVDGVSDIVVFEGNLYIGTQEPNAMEIGRYDGGTTFVQTNTPDGEFISTDATDIDGVVFKQYGNRLFVGAITGALTARISVYDGIGTTMTATQATLGTFDAVTQNIDVTSMKVWNGELYIAASKANSAGVYRWLPDPSMTISTVVTNYNLVSNAAGKLNSGDTANIDSVILQNYNGRLYAGSYNATDGTGALYEYDGTKGNWTLINTTRGDFNNNTTTDGIGMLIEFNGTLYVGVDDGTANKGAVYTWSKTSSNSYRLQFDSGNNNYGSISFIGNKQALTGDNKYGTFNFSNPIALSSGAFDYAEDYPTNDSSLTSGDVVTVDPNRAEYVVRAKAGNSIIGIVSKKPGFRLSTTETLEEGSKWIPIALVGRVPVKVSSINGIISAGDKLTISNIPGVAMKSSGGDETIGVALADYNQLDPNIIGEVSIFVNISYESKKITKEEFDQNNITVTENLLDNSKIYTLANSDLSKSINELGLFDQVKSSSITSGLINTADLTINGINFTNYITDINTKLSLLQSDSKPVTDGKTTENNTILNSDVSNEVKTETQSEFELLKKQLIGMIDDKFSSLSSTNTINSDVLGTSSTSINLPKLNTLSSKINILDDGSIEILGSVKFSELLNVESLKTKKISAYSGSDLIAELSDDNGKSKFSILSLTGKELFSVDSTGKTNINNDLTVKGDLNISGKIAGESVFESKWIEIPANSEISIKHDLGVIPRSINVLRASDSDCDSKDGELDCTNVTNEGFGNKDVYYYKNLDKSFIKVVNALSDKIFVKVFVTK